MDILDRLRSHEQWRSGRGGERLELEAENLMGQAWVGRDLRGARFTNCNMSQMHTTNCNFDGATFTGCSMIQCEHFGSNFMDGEFFGCNLSKSVIKCCQYNGAVMGNCTLDDLVLWRVTGNGKQIVSMVLDGVSIAYTRKQLFIGRDVLPMDKIKALGFSGEHIKIKHNGTIDSIRNYGKLLINFISQCEAEA